MSVEPRFIDQVRCLILKDPRAKALNEALSPSDRKFFNGFLMTVVAVLVTPRLGAECTAEELAAFSDEVAASQRKERRPVNEFVIEEIVRYIYGKPQLFATIPVPPAAVSTAGAAIVRHIRDREPYVVDNVDSVLAAAEQLHKKLNQG